MTPLEALRSATINGADKLGLAPDLGSVEAGKLADLVVLNADPLADIHNTAKIRWVIKNGTVYDAELEAPLDFGEIAATERTLPAPSDAAADSVLSARLLTALDSARTARGSAILAVLTRPLFSEDNRLILPEGTELRGEVTFAKPASHFRHNGQLRFLFEEIRAPGQQPESRRAALESAEVGRDAHLSIDDEGGASVTNPKSRFVAPALSLAAVSLSLRHERSDPDEVGDRAGGDGGTNGAGAAGFSGMRLLGLALSQVYRPSGVVLGFVGAARSIYGNLISKGKESSFPAGTRIRLHLAAAPSPTN
jgi:hypothetical protein